MEKFLGVMLTPYHKGGSHVGQILSYPGSLHSNSCRKTRATEFGTITYPDQSKNNRGRPPPYTNGAGTHRTPIFKTYLVPRKNRWT